MKILNIGNTSSGAATPQLSKGKGTTIGKGQGGATISEVVNFWKGSWAIGKGVNDLDWGSGSKSSSVSAQYLNADTSSIRQ